jgi:ABC-2 type transport system ATP-binding protein
MTEASNAITVTNLSKQFRSAFGGREVQALSDVSLNVQKADIFGLLGPNGAGKTTMVKILLGALHASGGGARINGFDVGDWRAREKAGFLPENHRFPPYLTGMQMLTTYGGLAGLPRSEIRAKADKLLELVRMEKWGSTKIKKYSKGMMQRLGLAQALLNDPEIIFLDEPTDGVDPIGRHEIRNILIDLKKQGKTIFLNSHLLAEVESICDRVAILDKGKLVKSGPIAGLIGAKPGYKVETNNLNHDTTEKIKKNFEQAEIDGSTITVTLDRPDQINSLIDLLRGDNVEDE